MSLDINYKKKTVRNTNTWRLNNTFLNNQQVTEEIKREIKKFPETNDSENTTQNLWDAAKAVLMRRFIAIQSYPRKKRKISYKQHNLTPRRRQWHPTPVLLPGKSHGQRSLVGCSPWGREELDTTERLRFHFSFSCIGEGNGNPLQCSCLENPRDRGAWWAAVYGVAQSRTRLK